MFKLWDLEKFFAPQPVSEASSEARCEGSLLYLSPPYRLWDLEKFRSSPLHRLWTLKNSEFHPLSSARTFLSLRSRLRCDGLVIVKADKGNALLLMDRSDYYARVYAFLTSSGAQELKKFSVRSFNTKVRSAISSLFLAPLKTPFTRWLTPFGDFMAS